MSMLKEFKEFINRGNVVDLAVAVVLGAAFGKIIASVVDNIINPLIGVLVGNVDLSSVKIVLRAAADKSPEVAIRIGSVLNDVINFVIIAFAIFLAVKLINAMKRKQAAEPPKPAEMSTEAKLLTEIRDEMHARK